MLEKSGGEIYAHNPSSIRVALNYFNRHNYVNSNDSPIINGLIGKGRLELAGSLY